MIKKNFATVEKLRNAIIEQHKRQPNVIVLTNTRGAEALEAIAKEKRQSVSVMENVKKRVKVLAITYDGKLHYFTDSKERILFLLQEEKRTTS